MAALKQIKNKIRSVEKTGKVTKAMEAVSAAKMRKTQERAVAGRTYARAAAEILARVSGSAELKNHPLTRRRPEGSARRALYIVITADRGLAGALNSGVLRAALADMEKTGTLKNGGARVFAVGRKAGDFFAARNVPVDLYYPNTDEVASPVVRELVRRASEHFSKGEVDVVKVVFQNFISTFEQRPSLRTIFPLSLKELTKVVDGILPVRGLYAAPQPIEAPQSYEVEPTERRVLLAILPRLAGVFIYHALLESHASEHSARMVAMKSASDKAVELADELRLDFNKARQTAITREVSEITSGMETLAA